MKRERKSDALPSCRRSERGAALITVLLVSTLLLSAGLTLVASTSLSSTATVDSTAEMQAYFGAESGLEATLNVLRGNVAPDASLTGTKINFRNAANPATANKTSDAWATGTSAAARLSGWLTYSYQNPSTANDWRVPVTASYAPLTGVGYKVLITDPDDPGPIATRKITTDASYQPSRLMIQSEGYGPKGAIKRLEMVVRGSAFDLSTPGTITLAGGSSVSLSLGNSAVVTYSGNDDASSPKPQIPAIAVSAANLSAGQTVINGLNGSSGSTAPSPCPGGAQVTPCAAASLTASNTPSFLQSADAARAFLTQMSALASSLGRSFPDKASADAAGGLGTTANPQFTFIDNYASGTAVDLGSNQQGSGLLIVTGDLNTHGNTSFQGVILVLGTGNMSRSGGGNGTIQGTIIIANFNPNGAAGDPFGNPSFSISGGGNSSVVYDSSWIQKALNATGMGVLGVREYH